MEGYAFGAFIGHDIKIVRGEKPDAAARRGVSSTEVLSAERPVRSAFVDRIVRAFRLACTAVDALGRNHNGH